MLFKFNTNSFSFAYPFKDLILISIMAMDVRDIYTIITFFNTDFSFKWLLLPSTTNNPCFLPPVLTLEGG